MSVVQEPEVKWSPEQMVEVVLNEPDDFLKVRETLTRIPGCQIQAPCFQTMISPCLLNYPRIRMRMPLFDMYVSSFDYCSMYNNYREEN